MKTPSRFVSRTLGTAALMVICTMAFTQTSEARDWWHRRHPHSDARAAYLAHPRSSFVITLGTGYAGRGYYYGPAGAPYYYEGPGVHYYRTRELVPAAYWGGGGYPHSHHSVNFSVQRALATRGYYHGPIDGDIGPGSRRAIARYQAQHGLRPTGLIDGALLRSLRIG